MAKTPPTTEAGAAEARFASGIGDRDGPVPDVGRGSTLAADEGDAVEAAPPRRRGCQMTPAQRALSLLVRREHSQLELRRKLVAKGVETEDADAAVERMTREGWQDDARFAASLARSRAGNGYGPLRIEAELAMHQLDSAQVAAAFDALDEDGEGDWEARACDLLARRYDGAALQADPALRRKAVDFLLRRGFGGELAYAAVRRLRER